MTVTRFKRLKLGAGLAGTAIGSDVIQISATGGTVTTDPVFDARGDLVVASGPDAADNLTVGANGQVLTADSAQTLGVKWAPAGGTVALLATWEGGLPGTIGNGQVWRIPYLNGVSVTFDLERAFFRIETAGTGSTQVRIESSPPGGAFTPTTVVSLTVAAAANETETVAALGSVDSGDLLRLVWVTVGADPAVVYTVELEGSEA